MTSKIVVNNIESDSGISSVTFTSDIELGTKNLKGHNLESTGIITGTTFSGSGANLIVHDGGSKPTEADCTNGLAALQAAWDLENDSYKSQRRAEYPDLVSQLDDIYHNGIDGWKTTIKAIKDKYPKPS